MSLFHFQHRLAKLRQGALPTAFPEDVALEIRFGPEDAFGVPCEPRTVALRAQPARILFNANEGVTHLEAELIAKITGTRNSGDLKASLNGNCLLLARRVDLLDEAIRFATWANQLLPPLLSLRFHTFVWIKEFGIQLGAARLSFEIGELISTIPTATTEGNMQRVWTCLDEWGQITPEHRRLVGALYYYRQALRLSQLQPDQISLVPEVVLNLTKALEIIFTDNRDTARQRARSLGFSDQEIEEVLVPVFLIRSRFDIAHVATGPLSLEERQVIVAFSSRAIANVAKILARVAQAGMTGQFVFDRTSTTLEKEKRELIEALDRYNRGTIDK